MLGQNRLALIDGARQFAETVKGLVQQTDRIMFAPGIRPAIETEEYACQRKPKTEVSGISGDILAEHRLQLFPPLESSTSSQQQVEGLRIVRMFARHGEKQFPGAG